MHSTLLEKIGKEQIKRTTGCEVKFWGALPDSGKKIGASETVMVSDATEKAADKKRYAPRKAKLYDSEKLYQYKVPDFSMQDLLSAIPAPSFHRSTLFS